MDATPSPYVQHRLDTLEKKFTDFETRIGNLESRIQCSGRYDSPSPPSATTASEDTTSQRSCYCGPRKTAAITHHLAEHITSVVGLREAVKSEHRVTKWVWIFLFLFGVGGTTFYLYLTTEEFLENPTATSVRLADDNRLVFPPLLLCPSIWFDEEKATALGLSMGALRYSVSFLTDSFSNHAENVSHARDEFLNMYKRRKFTSLLEYYKDISPGLEFETPNNTNVTSSYTCRDCVISSVAERRILDQRLCHIFKFKPVKKGFGAYSGEKTVRIKYTPNTENLTDSMDWDVYFKPATNALISVYPKLTVRSSFHNTINFIEERHVSLNRPPEHPCTSSREGYSSIECMAKCHNGMYQKHLDCGLLRLSVPPLSPTPTEYCNYMEKYPPKNLTLAEFFASDVNTRIDNNAADLCVNRCPPLCERRIFEITLQLQTRSSDIADKTKPEESEIEANTTYIEVELKHGAVYKGGVMILREMSTYSFTQWVNNVGGTLGLFVGATLMTFAQVILFFINYIIGKVGGGSGNEDVTDTKK